MKLLLYIIIIYYPCFAQCQIITTFAGDGSIGYSGDNGLATGAAIGEPFGCSFDVNGNFYFSDVLNDVVRKITPNGAISTIAGTGTQGYNADYIPAPTAELNWPEGIAIDSIGNIYIADALNSRIRKVDVVTGIICTVAGNGTWGFGGDGGAATASILYNPSFICFDRKGNLYISDPGNYRVRKINTSGIINTVAGNGTSGDNGDGGMATDANIEDMVGICTDESGNFYFAESGLRVRKVNIATGKISTIAGIDPEGSIASGDGGPATNASIDPFCLAFDKAGNLFISGYIYNNVRMIDNSGIIYTVAGNGVAAFGGDGGPATAAELYKPIGIVTDTCGNLYIADLQDSHIRKVAFNPQCLNLTVNNIKNAQSSDIYPNPVDDLLNVNNLKTPSTYRLLNIMGTMEQRGELKEGNNTIPMQELAKGMYLLEIKDEYGNKTVKKIMKE